MKIFHLMFLRKNFLPALLLVVMEGIGPSQGQAQDLPAGKVGVIGENPQLALRFRAVERLIDPLGTAAMAAKGVSNLAGEGFFVFLRAVGTCLAERSTTERWDQVIEEYERLLQDTGDVLVPLSAVPGLAPSVLHSANVCVQARYLCHVRLAELPPSLLAAYRRRVDRAAQKLFQQGLKERDPVPLRRLVDELFCSRWSEQALDLLGDLAFERGQFAEALYWWNLLAGGRSGEWRAESGDSGVRRAGSGEKKSSSLPTPLPALRFPDPKGNPAPVEAKRILARIFLGDAGQADSELQAFRQVFGQAQGHVAGQDGNLADILQDVLHRVRSQGFFQENEAWPTFAGDMTRQRSLVEAPHPRLWVDGPTWRVGLPKQTNTAPSDRLGRHPQPAFHPIVVDDQVLLADARSVLSYHLLTGKLLWHFPLNKAGLEEPDTDEDKPATELTPIYTLSAGRDRVFARLGKQTFQAAHGDKAEEGSSYLVCLKRVESRESRVESGEWGVGSGKSGVSRAESGEKKGTPLVTRHSSLVTRHSRLLWQVQVRTPSLFEGAPLVVEDNVFIAQTKVVGLRTQTALVCFDATTGKRRWLQEVLDCPEFEDNSQPRARHHLLTWAAGRLVYCSHAGAVVAVDPWTGRRLWALRYPRRGPRTTEAFPSPRQLAPCVFHHDRLFVAPLDSDRIFCLEPSSGRALWERSGLEVVHLLGAEDGRLFFTTPSGLQVLQADTGTDQGGWLQPGVGKLPGLGRGLLAGGWVLWPTQDLEQPYRALAQSDGSQEANLKPFYEPSQLRGLIPGNMVFANDCLVVAGNNELVGYVAPRRLFGKLQESRERSPADYYRWSKALADTGKPTQATEVLTRLAEKGPAWQAVAQQRLRDMSGEGSRARGKVPETKILAAPRPNAVSLTPGKVVRSAKSSGTLPLERTWEFSCGRLLTGDAPAWKEESFFLTLDGNLLTCRAMDSGASLWKQPLPFVPTWAGSEAAVIVVAGPADIMGLDRAKGQPCWHFSSPSVFSETIHVIDDCPTWQGKAGRLAGFRLVQEPRPSGSGPVKALPDGRGSEKSNYAQLQTSSPSRYTLFFIHDERHIFALDAVTGRLLWDRWAPAAQIRPLLEGGKFLPDFVADQDRVLLQTNPGKRWLLDGHTGEILVEMATHPWTGPALFMDAGQVCMTEMGGGISLVDLANGRVLWQHLPRWSTSRTGAPAQLLGHKDVLLALASMNYGKELTHLDRKTGTSLWPDPVLLPEELDIGRACMDDSACYLVLPPAQPGEEEAMVQCRSLTTGKLLWQRALPGQHRRYQAKIGGDCLLVYPADPLPPLWLPTPGLDLAYPLLRSLTSRPRPDFSVWVLDTRDGTPFQRLAISRGYGQVLVGPKNLVIANNGKGWGYQGIK